MSESAPIVGVAEETRPACPKCHIQSRVKKSGLLKRADSTIQNFRCVACSINFVNPEERIGPGPRRNDEGRETARRMRAEGKSYREIAEELNCGEHWAYMLCSYQFTENDGLKPEQAPAGSSGTWKIKPKLVRSLSAMFRASNGCTPTQEALDCFVSELLENQIADFRMYHADEVFKAYGRPVLKPTDPTKSITEVVE